MLFVKTFNQNFAKIWVPSKKFFNYIFFNASLKYLNTYGHKSKGVCNFRFFMVKSAPLAAKKQAIEADAFLSVFYIKIQIKFH